MPKTIEESKESLKIIKSSHNHEKGYSTKTSGILHTKNEKWIMKYELCVLRKAL